MSSGWVIGYVVGAVVVVLVVALLLILIFSARRIADQAVHIRHALEEARLNTLGLWEVDEVNLRVGSITSRMAEARRILGGSS